MTRSITSRTRSQQLFERAQQSLIEGVNSPSRGAAVYSPGPLFLERGQGSHVWDADGNEYIDFMMSFGALIHGHAHAKIVEVATQAMAEGSHFAAATSAEVEAARGPLDNSLILTLFTERNAERELLRRPKAAHAI